MKKRIQAFAMVFLTAAIIFFALQNGLNLVSVDFLFWEFQASVSLLVLIPLLAGLLIGAGTAVYFAALRRAQARRQGKGDLPPDDLPAIDAPLEEDWEVGEAAVVEAEIEEEAETDT